MEYRTWVFIAGLVADEQSRWEPFIERLEYDVRDYQPSIGWRGEEAHVVMSFEAADIAGAAAHGVALVADALQTTGLGELYPTRVELEALNGAGSAAAQPALH